MDSYIFEGQLFKNNQVGYGRIIDSDWYYEGQIIFYQGKFIREHGYGKRVFNNGEIEEG